MEVVFRGVRGTLPVTHAEYLRYGGNTPCLQVRAGTEALLIDAGTGIRAAGDELTAGATRPIHLLLSHAHWDHIQGFPHFAPLYDPDARVTVYGPRHPSRALRDLLGDQQLPGFCPTPLAGLPARLEFVELDDGQALAAGPARVLCRRLNHPGVVCGYRVEHGGRVLAYLCDVDVATPLLLADGLPADSPERRQEQVERLRQGARELAEGADLLVVDSFFLPDEYAADWGHGRPDDAVRLAVDCRARRLALFHHRPERTDAELDRLAAAGIATAGGRVEVFVAAEGMELSL
jgi:phosphoribosyl 1,2-cyclic phosphodiesterase